jgi:hypothetical protein
MKFKVLILFATVLVLAACSKDLLDVTFDANYETSFKADVDPSVKAEEGVFAVSDTIDPKKDEQVAEYFDRIKNFDLQGVDATIKNFPENFKLKEGTITITLEGRKAEWTFNDLDITEGFVINFNNDNQQFKIVNEILMQKLPFIISFEGMTDKKDFNFDVDMLMKTKVTANPLD